MSTVPADANWMKKDETPIDFFNPLASDFSVEYRHEDNIPTVYTVPAQSIAQHPKYLADHIIKHLVDAVMIDRDLSEDKREEVRAEIIVNV